MGNSNIKHFEYSSLSPNKKLRILKDFKISYSENFKCLEATITRRLSKDNKKYHIYSNNYNLVFNRESELVDFVRELGRPFIIMEIDKVYRFCFVYSKN